jgi:hypothetical protein
MDGRRRHQALHVRSPALAINPPSLVRLDLGLDEDLIQGPRVSGPKAPPARLSTLAGRCAPVVSSDGSAVAVPA